MLTYDFMIVAFIVSLLFGVLMPFVGAPAVYKRLSSSGDALSHSALAGVAIGLAAGLNPLWISILVTVIAMLLLDLLRSKFNKYAEIGVTVIFALSVGIAGILSGYTTASNFDSYLFGSILLVSDTELYLTIGLTAVVVLFSLIFYPQIFASLYSPAESQVNRIPLKVLFFFQDLFLAVTVALGSKIVGSLVVSSMVVLPTATALLYKKGYKATLIISLIYSVVSMGCGLTIAYYADFKPGATIVLFAVALLLVTLLVSLLVRKVSERKRTS